MANNITDMADTKKDINPIGNHRSNSSRRSLSHGGLPEFIHQAATVTTPCTSRVTRSVGVIPFDAAPAIIQNRLKGIEKSTSSHSVNRKEKFIVNRTYEHPAWSVTDENIPVLPELHPLEYTSVFVPHTRAAVVAERISKCLKLRSVNADYTADGKKAKAKCTTCDLPPVEFRVFMYRGKNSYSHGIIVEVQRRFGFSMNFFNDMKAIFDAAKGITTLETYNSIPELSLLSDDDNELMSFEAGEKMLQETIPCKNLLGVQFFVSMTDHRKTSVSKSNIMTRRLLSKPCQPSLKILMDFTQSSDESIHANILSVWTNMFSSLTSKDLSIVEAHEEFFTTKLTPMLLEDIKSVKKSLQNTCVALRCVYNMLKKFPTVFFQSYKEESDFLEALEVAKDVGFIQHESLSRYAILILGVLNSMNINHT